MTPETHERLEAALAAEAVAYLRYRLAATQARQDDQIQIAELLERAAASRAARRARPLAELLGMTGSTRDILAALLDVPMPDCDAASAACRAVGDSDAADAFDRLATEHDRHAGSVWLVAGALAGRTAGRAA
jgi:rubrerythrin